MRVICPIGTDDAVKVGNKSETTLPRYVGLFLVALASTGKKGPASLPGNNLYP